jgi:hypothetical protein
LIAEKLDINLKSQARGELGAVERRGGEAQGMPGVDLGGLFLGKKKKKGMGRHDEAGNSALVPWSMAPRAQEVQGQAGGGCRSCIFSGVGAGLAAVYVVRYWVLTVSATLSLIRRGLGVS